MTRISEGNAPQSLHGGIFTPKVMSFEELHSVTASCPYSSITYKDETSNGTNRRGSNVEEIGNVLIYDIDSGLTLSDAIDIAQGYKNLIVTSRNHQKDKKGFVCDRFRVIILLDSNTPLSLAISKEDYPAFYTFVAEYLGFNSFDKATKDIARFYYPNPEQIVNYSMSDEVLKFETLYEDFLFQSLLKTNNDSNTYEQNERQMEYDYAHPINQLLLEAIEEWNTFGINEETLNKLQRRLVGKYKQTNPPFQGWDTEGNRYHNLRSVTYRLAINPTVDYELAFNFSLAFSENVCGNFYKEKDIKGLLKGVMKRGEWNDTPHEEYLSAKSMNIMISKKGENTTQNRLIRASDFTKNITAPKWLINNILPDDGIVEFIGASGSYKSFIVLDMLFCIASELKYHGAKVERGTAVYIAGEGANGVKTRLKALEINYNINEYDFLILPMPSNLTDGDEVRRLSDEIKDLAPKGVAITVFDTLHRNSVGSDENSSKDFAVILGHIDTYLKPISKTVGWVHHTGLAGDAQSRGRGTSSRYGALDTQILIDRTKDYYAVMKCTKQKDSEPFFNTLFELKKTPLGIFEEPEEDDDFGPLESKEIFSLVPMQIEGKIQDKPKSKLKKEHYELIDCLHLAISKSGRELSDEIKNREGLTEGRGIFVSEWKAEAMKVMKSNGDNDPKKQIDAKTKTFRRYKNVLIDEGQISEYDNTVWIVEDCKQSYSLRVGDVTSSE